MLDYKFKLTPETLEKMLSGKYADESSPFVRDHAAEAALARRYPNTPVDPIHLVRCDELQFKLTAHHPPFLVIIACFNGNDIAICDTGSLLPVDGGSLSLKLNDIKLSMPFEVI